MKHQTSHFTAHDRATVRERGSAFIIAIVVLALLVTVGLALLFVADSDAKMNAANVRDKRAFYIAEAGLEDARDALRTATMANPTDKLHFTDELKTAAGADHNLNFNVASLKATYDANGNVTGFTGYGDDVPLKTLTAFEGGWYAAFLTNDAAESPGGETSTTDLNQRVTITSIGAGANHSIKIIQAIVEKVGLPGSPRAYITLPGPAATAPNVNFDGASSNTTFNGTDCYNLAGHPGSGSVPVIGTFGTAATTQAQAGLTKPANYTSGVPNGSQSGIQTVQDITGTGSAWNSCPTLRQMADQVRSVADGVCSAASPCSNTYWQNTTNQSVTFVDGNWSPGSGPGKGLIWVTGQVNIGGGQSFEGTLLVIGQGRLIRTGGGNGYTYGAIVVANIAGPDGVFGTADDCTGGVQGFQAPTYSISGGGNHTHVYCSDIVNTSLQRLQDKVASFRQY